MATFVSWARGAATSVSGIDVLLVADALPSGRHRRVAEFESVEAATGAALHLDMTDWCDVFADRHGFFTTYLSGLRDRMRASGTRRVRSRGGYYREYRLGSRAGQVIDL